MVTSVFSISYYTRVTWYRYRYIRVPYIAESIPLDEMLVKITVIHQMFPGMQYKRNVFLVTAQYWLNSRPSYNRFHLAGDEISPCLLHSVWLCDLSRPQSVSGTYFGRWLMVHFTQVYSQTYSTHTSPDSSGHEITQVTADDNIITVIS